MSERRIDEFGPNDEIAVVHALYDEPRTVIRLSSVTGRRVPTVLAVMRHLLTSGQVEAVPGQPGVYRLTDGDEETDGEAHDRTRRENPRE